MWISGSRDNLVKGSWVELSHVLMDVWGGGSLTISLEDDASPSQHTNNTCLVALGKRLHRPFKEFFPHAVAIRSILYPCLIFNTSPYISSSPSSSSSSSTSLSWRSFVHYAGRGC